MAKMIVETNGWFQCDGQGYCGGTVFESRERVMDCFHCDCCKSYQKNGLKIIRKDQNLKGFFK